MHNALCVSSTEPVSPVSAEYSEDRLVQEITATYPRYELGREAVGPVSIRDDDPRTLVVRYGKRTYGGVWSCPLWRTDLRPDAFTRLCSDAQRERRRRP